MSNKKTSTTEAFVIKANKIHNNKYDYSKSVYIGSKYKVKIICPIHKEFEQKASIHLSGAGCYDCGLVISATKNSITNDEFINKSKIKHNNKYDYSLCNYIKGTIKVKIICNKHNIIFKIRPSHHLSRDGGCKSCKVEKSKIINTLTNNEFIDKANKIHNFEYDYSKCNYIKTNKKVLLICKEHGEFNIIAHNHLNGCGCHTCGRKLASIQKSSTLNEFIESANKTHNYRYDYSKSIYTGCNELLTIICHRHGEFKQTPAIHVNGSGCTKCTKSISNIEIKWLDSLNIAETYRHSKLKINCKNFKLDAFDPKTNTIYEFNGDYYHGNPAVFKPEDYNETCKKTYGELYERTLLKEKLLKEAGYNVTSIWENDFKKKLKNDKRKLKVFQ